MKAMILAAGTGARLKPLTDWIPKPMISVAGKPLVEQQVLQLARVGVTEIVINISHLSDALQHYLGDGSQFGVKIFYSVEAAPLETGGGLFNALPKLGEQPFIAINGDVFTDYPFEQLIAQQPQKAHLVLVETPSHYQTGDFALQNGFIQPAGDKLYTYAGIAVYNPKLFAHCQPGKFPIMSLLQPAIEQQQVSGEFFSGQWCDIGTPQGYRCVTLIP